MADSANLAAAAEALGALIKKRRLPVTVMLSEDRRMLTALPENGRESPGHDDSLKNPRRGAPEDKAFELSVALRPAQEGAMEQRMMFPSVTATPLRLEGDRAGLWTLAATSGDEIAVRLALGTTMTNAEANELLATLEQALAPLLEGK